MACTTLSATDTISLPIPQCGAGSVSVYGWARVAASLGNEAVLFNSAFAYIQRLTAYGGYVLDGDNKLNLWNDHADGWVWLCVIYSTTQVTVKWRRDGMRGIASVTYVRSYGDSATSFLVGDTLNAGASDVQYWGCYVGAMTDAQCLTQSQTTSAFAGSRSFWPFADNSGEDTEGTYDATMSGTAAGSLNAPASTLPAVNNDLCSLVLNNGERLYVDWNPFATSQTITVSYWSKLAATGSPNAYAVAIWDGTQLANGGMIFVVQHNDSSAIHMSNIMSETQEWGDGSTTVTEALATGWVFTAWVIERSGGDFTHHTYKQFGIGGTLSQTGTQTVTEPACPTDSSIWLQVGQGSSDFEICHVRVHTSALSLETLQALAISDANDTTAGVHLKMKDADPADYSGNSRTTHIHDVWPGSNAPVFDDGGDHQMDVTTTATTTTWGTQDVDWHAAGGTWESAGAVAYSSSGGTTVSPAYPTSIRSTDALVLMVAMKPSSANGGSCTTPSGWTPIPSGSITGAGGYGATLGADTGNTNIWTFTKDTVTGSESGNLSVTVGTNNVCWAQIHRVSRAANATGWSYAATTGSDTSAGNVSVTFGADPGISENDIVIVVFNTPTDVSTPNQYSAEAISATGCTFGTVTELVEADSTTGNDIGGVVCYAKCTAGPSSAAPVFTATAGGTTTNVRGPAVFVRVRATVASNAYQMQATSTSTASTASSQTLRHTGICTATATSTASTAGSQALLHNRLCTATATGTVSTGIDVALSPGRRMNATATATASTAGSQGLTATHRTGATPAATASTAGNQALLHAGRMGATPTETATSWPTVTMSPGRLCTATATSTASAWSDQGVIHSRVVVCSTASSATSWSSQDINRGGAIHWQMLAEPTATVCTGTNAQVRHISQLVAESTETVTDYQDSGMVPARLMSATSTATASPWSSVTVRRGGSMVVQDTATGTDWTSQALLRTRILGADPWASSTNWSSVEVRHFAVGRWQMIAESTATATTGTSATILGTHLLAASVTSTSATAQSQSIRSGRHAFSVSTDTSSTGSSAGITSGHRMGATHTATATSWSNSDVRATHRVVATVTNTSASGSACLNVGRWCAPLVSSTSTSWASAALRNTHLIVATSTATGTTWARADIDYSGELSATPWEILATLVRPATVTTTTAHIASVRAYIVN